MGGDVKGKLKKAQDSIRGTITSKGGDIQAQMQSAYNGFQASVPVDQVDAVASLPGVVAVHPVRTYAVDNAVSVPFLGVPSVWQSTGYTGKDVKVAIIDSGIDYTDADFGGPGTVDAYKKAKASNDLPGKDSGLYDSKKFLGGYDLAGDAYDAQIPTSVPKPDNNPLDCEAGGHGTHVAGTTAGYGVGADGKTYKGDFTKLTQEQVGKMRIGPGTAPEAQLIGLRVFGCEGSTNLVLDALDRRESAGAHFREEYATQGGEAQRNDETWCSVSAWQTGPDGGHTRRTEPLSFSLVPMQVRDYR